MIDLSMMPPCFSLVPQLFMPPFRLMVVRRTYVRHLNCLERDLV